QRQLDPASTQEVARDRAVAAAVADDCDPAATRTMGREQRLRRVDELSRRLDEMDPTRARRRLDGVATARERARVRACGAATGVGATDGEEDDRLARRPGRFDEGAAVEEVLAVDADHPRPLVLSERGDELGCVHVRLVADRDRAGETEPRIL